MYSRVFSDFLNLDCSSRSSDDALDAEEEAEEENDDDEGGATDEAAALEDEAGGMMNEKIKFQIILKFDFFRWTFFRAWESCVMIAIHENIAREYRNLSKGEGTISSVARISRSHSDEPEVETR